MIILRFNLLKQVESQKNEFFLKLNYKALKIKLLIFYVLILMSNQAQISEEKILEHGSHYIAYIPRLFSKEELANRKYRRIPTTADVQKYPLITLSNLFKINLESSLKFSVTEDSSLVANK